LPGDREERKETRTADELASDSACFKLKSRLSGYAPTDRAGRDYPKERVPICPQHWVDDSPAFAHERFAPTFGREDIVPTS